MPFHFQRKQRSFILYTLVFNFSLAFRPSCGFVIIIFLEDLETFAVKANTSSIERDYLYYRDQLINNNNDIMTTTHHHRRQYYYCRSTISNVQNNNSNMFSLRLMIMLLLLLLLLNNLLLEKTATEVVPFVVLSFTPTLSLSKSSGIKQGGNGKNPTSSSHVSILLSSQENSKNNNINNNDGRNNRNRRRSTMELFYSSNNNNNHHQQHKSHNNGPKKEEQQQQRKSKSSSSKSTMTDVLYQRVIRPSTTSNGIPDFLFLGYLIEYLESYYKLPTNDLSMIYETILPSKNNEEESNQENFVVAFDSPLSPNSDATRMEVEVIGIFTDNNDNNNNDDNNNNKNKKNQKKGFAKSSSSSSSSKPPQQPQPQPSIPSMAMVVVKKKKKSSSSSSEVLNNIPPMMKNLFDDSEKKIIKSLDLGLQDFVSGKIKFRNGDRGSDNNNNKPTNNNNIPPNVQTAEEAIEIELVGDDDDDDYETFPTTSTSTTTSKQYRNGSSYSSSTSSSSSSSKQNMIMDAQIIDDDDDEVDALTTTTKTKDEKKENNNVPLSDEKDDADVVEEDFAIVAARRLAKDKKKKKATTTASSMKQKQQQQQLIIEKSEEEEEFAVAAARKISKVKKGLKPKSTTTKQQRGGGGGGGSSSRKETVKGSRITAKQQQQQQQPSEESITTPVEIPKNFQVSDYLGNKRAFKHTLSRPSDRKKKMEKKMNKVVVSSSSSAVVEKKKPSPPKTKSMQKQKVKGSSALLSSKDGKKPDNDNDVELKSKNNDVKDIKSEIDKQVWPSKKKPDIPTTTARKNNSNSKSKNTEIEEIKKRIERDRNLNLNVVSEDDSDKALQAGSSSVMNSMGKEGGEANESLTTKNSSPSRNDIELEVMKAAQNVMNEIAENSDDMTAEELLKDVLKFGEEKKKEETPGQGFVTGAFEKANELMRERHQQRQSRIENQKQVKERIQTLNDIRPNIVDPYSEDEESSTKTTAETTEMTAEEELRQMFEAGERIADGRITKSTKNGDLATKGTTEADVDRLIAEEKSISSYARVLDDELAELEIAINKSPGEELDGPVMKNPMFDIMSGPEVYDPNVDPATVNYPGAIPGTKNIRLPKELDEAIKQSKFAVEILTNLRIEEETVDDEEGGGGGTTTKERYFMGKKEFTSEQVQSLKEAAAEAVEIGLIQDPLEIAQQRSQLQMIIDEMWNQPTERFHEIASNYKDVLLSENFVALVKERLTNMADRDLDALRQDDESLKEPHDREREILGHLVNYAQLLLKEARALGAELEAQQLEIIRSICKVAMDPAHATEEETAMALSDAVRDMRPLLDDMFVAYLKYAVAEEEGRLARAGLLDDPEYNQWLFVLKIVQQGVYTEIAKTINRYIDHIGYVLRMETPQQRRKLLSRLIDDMPTMDVRPFVQVVENIAGSLGDGAKGDFDGVDTLGGMANVILQLRRDVHELLPPERIARKARDADEWAAKQREKLMEARNATRQRLQAAKDTEHLQDEIEALGRSRIGEVDKFD